MLPRMDQLSPADSRPGVAFRLAQRVFLFGARLTRGMTLGVRGMVLDGENRIFLVKHSYVRGWHMPGGGVDPGETLAQALAKELAEEGNIRITGETALLGVYLNRQASRRDHVAVFVVRAFEQAGPRPPDREIVDCGFFPLDALPEETTRATRRRVAEALDGVALAHDW
jgi:8-oxo-dGTP pyrophosphatase MutT (NUDIX family)